jgi:hypothetical protein
MPDERIPTQFLKQLFVRASKISTGTGAANNDQENEW